MFQSIPRWAVIAAALAIPAAAFAAAAAPALNGSWCPMSAVLGCGG